jgi:hypothetical protein
LPSKRQISTLIRFMYYFCLDKNVLNNIQIAQH